MSSNCLSDNIECLQILQTLVLTGINEFLSLLHAILQILKTLTSLLQVCYHFENKVLFYAVNSSYEPSVRFITICPASCRR